MVAIVKRRRYACRCRFCTRRRSLRASPDDYIRIPRCWCGGERRAIKKARDEGRARPPTWRIDKYRTDGREQRGKTCRCDGYSYPHFRGRGYCDRNPRLTAEMLRERQESGSWS